MLEGPWQPAHNGEPHALPQLDSAVVLEEITKLNYMALNLRPRFVLLVGAHGLTTPQPYAPGATT